MMRWDLSTNTLSAHSLSFSMNWDSYFGLGSNMSLCHSCLNVACVSGSTFFCRNTIIASSRVSLFTEFIFLKVSSVFSRKC